MMVEDAERRGPVTDWGEEDRRIGSGRKQHERVLQNETDGRNDMILRSAAHHRESVPATQHMHDGGPACGLGEAYHTMVVVRCCFSLTVDEVTERAQVPASLP